MPSLEWEISYGGKPSFWDARGSSEGDPLFHQEKSGGPHALVPSGERPEVSPLHLSQKGPLPSPTEPQAALLAFRASWPTPRLHSSMPPVRQAYGSSPGSFQLGRAKGASPASHRTQLEGAERLCRPGNGSPMGSSITVAFSGCEITWLFWLRRERPAVDSLFAFVLLNAGQDVCV